MRITKLHVLLFLLVCALGAAGLYITHVHQTEEAARLAAEKEARRRAEALELAQKPVTPPAPPAAAPAPVAPPRPSSATYTVQKGDTLWKIAKSKDFFGEGHRWYDIWKANESTVDDFDHIEAGQVLVIPLAAKDGYAWPKTPQEKRDRLLRVGSDGTAEEDTDEEDEQQQDQTPPPAPATAPAPAPAAAPEPTD